MAALVRAWVADDPDESTRKEVTSWLTDQSIPVSFIEARLSASRLTFGTAGIRAKMGPGHDRLNVRTIIAATQGLQVWLGKGQHAVVIGYDARENSAKFAHTAAHVLLATGVGIFLCDECVPTPLLAFLVKNLRASAGVMITSSHNPRGDNGYKVFGPDGAQLRPYDTEAIENGIRANYKPWRTYCLSREFPETYMLNVDLLMHAYAGRIASDMKWRSDEHNRRTAPVVYSAFHGVGFKFVNAVFKEFALPPVVPCEQQVHPDPTFPTLPKPNPEEKGAMNLAVATARAKQIPLVLANDPDADRLCAAELDRFGNARIFTGDEMALLLVNYLLMRHALEELPSLVVTASTVSSKALQSLARKRGIAFRESLTGFKWLSHVALDEQSRGKTALFTYEEAIGFMIGTTVHDKDGVSAAAVFAEMAGHIYANGETLEETLNKLYDECGWHVSRNGSLKLSSHSPSAKEIFDKARRRGFPTALAGASVHSVRDLTLGTDTGENDGKARMPADASNQFLTLRCTTPKAADADDVNLTIHIRASGTGKDIVGSPILYFMCTNMVRNALRIGQLLFHLDALVPMDFFGRTVVCECVGRYEIGMSDAFFRPSVSFFVDLKRTVLLQSPEPKIKYYGELRCDRECARSGDATAILQRTVDDAIDTVLRPKETGLATP